MGARKGFRSKCIVGICAELNKNLCETALELSLKSCRCPGEPGCKDDLLSATDGGEVAADHGVGGAGLQHGANLEPIGINN